MSITDWKATMWARSNATSSRRARSSVASCEDFMPALVATGMRKGKVAA